MKQSSIICAVFDIKHNHYHTPFVVPQIGNATRWFSDQCNDASTPMGRNPTEYHLHHVASISTDDEQCDVKSEASILLTGTQATSKATSKPTL